MRLDELQTGQKAKIVKILGHGAFRKRLIEMGFVKGHDIEVLLHAPLKDPIKYSIMGYEISLRRSEAHLVEVTPFAGEQNHARSGGEKPADVRHRPAHVINVALVGNPNCGKTSLFNVASGAKEHVGNYSGVTVDAKSGHFDYKGYRFNIVDLPGTYSLASYSPEELYVRKYLRDATPDVIINVVVASNLERNLYLTTELIDMDRSMVIALNMYDELEKRGDRLDYKLLGSMIGVPVVPTVSRTGQGLNELFDTVINVYEGRDEDVRHVHVNLGEDIERGVTAVKDLIKAEPDVSPRFSPRFIAIKLLEDDAEVIRLVESLPGSAQIMEATRAEQQRIELMRKEDASSAIADEKYGFIAGALAETLVKGDQDRNNPTNIIDAFVTNKLFGFPIFLLIMFAIFWATFEIGQYPMDWIEWLVGKISQMVQGMMPDGPLKDLIADGIIGGVGGVIVFLPNILILYFCISFMEDSGYMARAAFIMDKLMHRIGLHGKSFIPLIMGFGCTVPSIMATRSIESRTSRLITILINPFMSCSARLPVYVLLVGTFFERHAALVILGLYCLGVAVAMVTARLLRKFKFTTDVTPFVMELPPYRIPTLKASLRHTWGKGQQYLKKMGGVILVASIIVWALNYFPIHDRQATVADADDAQRTTAISDDSQIDVHRDSYLEMAGKIVNPVMEPLGFHWRASVAALAGIPAKEIVVSTLGVLYTGDEEIDNSSLSARLTAVNPATGTADFSAASALSFMIFILLYCPCIATVAAIVKETNSWKYGAFSVVYNTLLAWLVALAAYHIVLPFC
ncbi:ferrous iron transport protein B [Paramuribaculum intestinale]|uniref:ferrous iron transport protein B n=1 Tax=Paramuribaculum intestinale TaxID=2094151 RepID=UPI0025AA14E8|nr:ferrous iron transport protein B [Paramuribaculum intestinale]